uniref:Cilia- and flagella-associated protein 43 n=1 Tax=Strigamia maritima TaxID=126957 RepID=T1IMG4_STRMM
MANITAAGVLSLKWIYGWNSSTVQFITNDTICCVCGNHVVFVQIDTNQTENILTSPGLGIVEFTANRLDSVFAFAEICVNPRIFIYNYPSLKTMCELTDGADLEINSIRFSWDTHLLSLSGLPDYKITIWKWTDGQKLCTIDADQTYHNFISFNPCNWRNICTMQNGNITLWDIYHYNKKFVCVPKSIAVTQVPVKQTQYMPQQGYKGLVLPEMEIDPPNKYQLPNEDKSTENYLTRHCWLPNNDILVSTNEGEIWKIDGEKSIARLIWDYKTRRSSLIVTDMPSMKINSMVYHQTGLYIGSEEGVIIKFRIVAKNLKPIAYFKFSSYVKKMQLSPNFKTLMISCANGSILTCEAASDIISPMVIYPEMLKIVASSMLPPWSKYILVLLEDGTVLTLSQENKDILSIINVPSKCISIACSPLWCGAVVGTNDGKIYILEQSKYSYPRVIFATALHKIPIKMIRFDNSGFLCVLVSVPKIYFISGKASANFEVLGYIDLDADVLDICTWESKSGDVHFIFVHKPDNTVTHFTRVFINKNITASQAHQMINMEGKFSDASVCKRTWLTHTSCMGLATENGENVWYTFVNMHKHFIKFGFPDTYEHMSKDNLKIQIFSFIKSYHELSDVSMASNLTYQQIITIGNDGKLICRYAVNMDSVSITDADIFVEKGCGSSLFLPRSGCNILVITSEGYLLLYSWANPTAESPLSIRKKSHPYRELPDFGRENMLVRLKPAYLIATIVNTQADASQEQKFEIPSSSPWSDNHRAGAKDSYVPGEILEQWPDFELSWAEQRKKKKYEIDMENSKSQIVEIQKTIKRLGFKVAKLLVDNDLLPETEQIPRQEFDLDRERQITLHDANKAHLTSIRFSTARRNLRSNFMWNKAFHADMQVVNFPLRSRTDPELELLDRIMMKRLIEVNNHKLLVQFGFNEPIKWRAFQREIEMDETAAVDQNYRIIHMGSQSIMFGVDNPYLHSQFELYTRDQKRSQIVLLQDLVRKIKEQFNKMYNDIVTKKETVFQKIQEKNTRMRQIVEDISLPTKLWSPEWTSDEKPEKCLVVLDSEMKSERFYTPEQKVATEKKRLEEEEMRKKKNADDFKRRAIGKMMGGVLQSRREDEIFNKEIPVPAFVLKKTPEQFNVEEKGLFEIYTKKLKELNEEKEKLRKQLEVEFNRNNEIVHELAANFDEEVKDLVVKKFKAQMLVLQEELKILRLNLSMAYEEELDNQKKKLLEHVEKLKNQKAEVQTKIVEIQKAVQSVQEEYDTLVVEERQTERNLKKELGDMPTSVYETVVRLFRKKPRVQRPVNVNPCQQTTASGGNPFGDGPFGRELAEAINLNFTTALSELDDTVYRPEGLYPNQWTQFCKLRKQKIDLELQIKQRALVVADMMTYLQSKQVENDNRSKEIAETTDMIGKLIHDKNIILSNLDIQIILKLGQVELDDVNGFLPDYGSALLIHRSLVEERNKQIRALGEMKEQSILENTNMHNMIDLREWEHRSKQMMVEDLVAAAKDIQKMQVTREIKAFLKSKSRYDRHAIHMMQLEDTLNLMKKLHNEHKKDEEKRQERAMKIKKYIEQKNEFYDKKLQKINNVLSRWKLIPKADDDTSYIPSRQFEEVVHWRGLVRKAAEQRVTLLELKKQMNAIWARSVPMLASSDKNYF